MYRMTLCFLFATTLFAADVRFGPETRIASPLDIGPAAFNQEQPAVASNGRDFVAVWIDRRGDGLAGGDGTADPNTAAPLYATRIGTDGRPAEPLGIRLAEAARAPHIASAGDGYLIAFTANGSNVLRVDENGHPLADARRLSATRQPQAIASNGATYLLFESPGVVATLLDRDGAPLTTIDATFGSVLWAGAYDGRYVVVDVPAGCDGGCKGAPRLNVINGSGSVLSRVSLPLVPLHNESLAAVASRDRVVITSTSSLADSFVMADYEGHVVRPLLPLSFESHPDQSGVQWDGRDFLLTYGPTYSGAEYGVFARRMAPNGDLLGDRFLLASTLPLFASNVTKQLMIWSARDVFGRAADDFASLANAPQESNLISSSPAAQYDVHVAGNLAVWRDSNGAITGTLNGNAVPITRLGCCLSHPAIAMGKKNYLVAWRLQSSPALDPGFAYARVLARRVAFDGTVLDSTPLVLATSGPTDDAPAVTYDGNAFVVAAVAAKLHIARVTDDGVIEEQRDLPTGDQLRWPTPVMTASRLLIAHASVRFSEQWSIGIDGAPLFVDAGTGGARRVAAATDRSRVTLAWMTLEGSTWTIRVAQLNAEGQVIAGPRRLRDIDGIPTDTIELAWNGSEYVLAWNDKRGRLRALRLNRFAEAIDSEPFDVTQQPPFSRFSLMPSPAGVTFGYDRVDLESAGVTRAFTRTLERTESAPPRRSVRH